MVTMIDGSPKPITSTALNSPMASPATSPRAMQSSIGTPARKQAAKMQADSAIVAAGDRSISPAMMTSVSTSATMANSM